MHENTGAPGASTTHAYDPRTLDQLRLGAEVSITEAAEWFEKAAQDLRWHVSRGNFRDAYGCFVSMCRPAGIGVNEAFITLQKVEAQTFGSVNAGESVH